MSDILTPDLCVIGAGSGGLSVAAGAVQMGAEVVAEGIESGDDYDVLVELGVRFGQGYLFGQPQIVDAPAALGTTSTGTFRLLNP